ncbi:SUN domain-containing protein 1-like isoform X5 [Acanthopagrus latus]|uniref:SUN domain-containing protein 1-like isoform X5 n=1 Tax=Acanthopagrus latus TaxID=8177 RepID=UPI00187C150D|nr:SUN domain-containing protein 1-like isoform X5 [Acanthopagrus latus]
MCVCVCVCAGPLFPGMSCEEDVDLQSWGWTNLSSYSSAALDSEKEQLIVSTMSRRSLRLDDGLLDRGLPHSSASFSVGGPSWRSSRSMKSRRSQQLSVSCSESLLLSTPRKLAAPSLLNSSVASDASLLSSLLDDSSVQESTMVDTFWGLDHDGDAKESTIIAEHSTILADGTLIGSDCPKHPVQTLSQVYCKDCELQSDRKESTHCASSKYTCASSAVTGPRPGPSGTGDQDTSTIYCRDRSRKNRTGVLASMWDRSAAHVFSLFSLLYHQLMLQRRHDVTDVLQLWLGSCLLCVRRAAACCVSVLTHTWQVCYGLASKCDNRHGARSSHCGVMTLRESTKNHKELHPTGSLCATAADVYRWLNRRWHHMTASIFLTRFPLRLLLVLVPLLLLFSLCWFCSAGLQSVLPAVSEWRAGVPDVPALSSIYSFMSPRSQSAEGAVQPYEEPLYSRPPPAETPSAKEEASAAASADEATRLVHLEQSLAALWDRVDVGGRQAERRHEEVLRLYADLQQQQVSGQSSGEEVWLSELLQQQLEQLQARLDEDRRQREQTRQQDLSQQQSQASRLDQLELQLQSLAAKTEEVQWRQEAAAPSSTLPAAVSVGVDRQSHDALLAVVARLEAALEDLRRDVTGLSGCRDGCRHLDRIQQMISDQVSVQVREEVRTLVYGNQLTVGGGASGDQAGLPESLLQWLSQQYVSGADLQASLSSLELRILQNISLQLEQHRSEETVTEAVLHAAEAAGASVTREDVHVIVQNALRLFSQDRTGLADYALESGGGSILSTRCSETYETKAALLSLFGVPLWYFSQSPRAVIQPDVHPGSCWAFRGSKGFLVIRLSMRILPTAFSLEHIPKALAPSGTLRSAPRDFRVYGLDDESQERGELLGTYTYDEDGEALQTYPVTEESDRAFQVIEVQVLSNWGHPDYTCMYRFRVHGTPGDL